MEMLRVVDLKKWLLGSFRKIMVVYGNAGLSFQAGIFPSCSEYVSEEHCRFVEFSSKVKCLRKF